MQYVIVKLERNSRAKTPRSLSEEHEIEGKTRFHLANYSGVVGKAMGWKETLCHLTNLSPHLQIIG